MGYLATKPIRLQRTLLADLMYLLCLVSLGFVDRGAIAQEGVGQNPATDPTVLTVEQCSKIRHSCGIADMPPARRGLGYAG